MTNDSMLEIIVGLRMLSSHLQSRDGVLQLPVSVCLDESDVAKKLSRDIPQLKMRARHDHQERGVLACNAEFTGAQLAEKISALKQDNQPLPSIVALDGIGLFFVGETREKAAHLREKVLHQNPVEPLPGTQMGRLAGVCAIVTGGAQGFGKGIAEELAAQGASVTIADINDTASEKLVSELNARFGKTTAIFCHTDVTSAESLDACVTATVKAFGGVDMFIANAGVLKAGALAGMSERDFDLVTSVNYKAFFLCSRAAAKLMQLQHKYNPAHWMDIIQINSKSGLSGSNKNFAYAGSKFGGIGLVQSFALELASDNIKVNAICPGNYYDGPLWSDPERGLFKQYLQTGKVPGAKTIEDVKAFYMAKAPIQRGCLPSDVARAIFYCHEQCYETGQALAVTGGQVMLH